jgi:hypothetical protein
MQWKPFTHLEKTYPLNHLHPFSFDMILAAEKLKPERRYLINVEFSLHCFSRGAAKDEKIPTDLAYSDTRETRIFDFTRYQKSHDLPNLVRGLTEKRCYHDAYGNFYVFEIVGLDGLKSYYSVFFTLSKAGRKAGLNLFISSAHFRDEQPYSNNLKPIKFRVIVHNTWIKKGIIPAP